MNLCRVVRNVCKLHRIQQCRISGYINKYTEKNNTQTVQKKASTSFVDKYSTISSPEKIPLLGVRTSTPIHSTQSVQSLGQILLFAGFATLAFGTKYYIQGARAYREEVRKRKQQELGDAAESDFLDNKKFYEGGFDTSMTPREAALILGCRESACKEQIMERYRTLIRLNHPDIGGSPLIASKVNDAKTLLHSGARSDPTYTQRKAERERRKRRRLEENNEMEAP